MKKCLYLLLFLLLFFPSVNAQEQASEILGITSLGNVLDINVAKTYPQVQFSIYKNEKKILIELLNTKYHETFMFDVPMKINIVSGLDFAEDASVGESKVDIDKYKVGIWITLKEDIELVPKVASKQGNVIKIEFPKKDQIQQVEKIESKREEHAVLDNNPSDPLGNTNEPSNNQFPMRRDENSDNVPQNIVELYNQATDEYTKGNIVEAEDLYKKVLEKDQGFFLAKFNLANIYLDKEKYDEASKLLQELDEKFEYFKKADEKNLLIVKNTLGIVYYSKGDYEKALEEFKEIIQMNPNVYEPYYNVGLIYEKTKDIEEAKEYFKKAIAQKNDFADAYYHLGMLYSLSNKKKQAVENFKKAQEIDPSGRIGKLSQKELDKLEK